MDPPAGISSNGTPSARTGDFPPRSRLCPPARALRRFASRKRGRALTTSPATVLGIFLGILLGVAGCGDQEDWSPLDGPWDPNHPAAAAILAPPPPGSPIDVELAEAGERWYRMRGCLACHALDGTHVVGPPLNGTTRAREYEWYRGMVMRPDSMLRVDPVARELLEIYRMPMPDQGLDELRTRAIWEYLRTVE